MIDGVYFLANDHVLNWSIAFFESLRTHEPDMRLVMIPFDDRIEKIAALRDRYRFEIFDHPSLKDLDEIGRSFFPKLEVPARTFRKFAVFWGPLERFIFSDVDIVFLEGLKQFGDAFERSQLDLLYSDEDIRQVYEQMSLRQKMIDLNGARGINTGFWAMKRELFTLDRVRQFAEESRPVAAEFNQGTYEQPFLNYCFDMSRLRYAQFAQFMPGLTGCTMSQVRGVRKDSNGVYRIMDRKSPEFGKRIALIHWAGTPATPVMPYRSIFLHYRLMRDPLWWRVWRRLKEAPREVVWRIIRFSRQTGLISRTYKRLMPAKLQARFSRRLAQK